MTRGWRTRTALSGLLLGLTVAIVAWGKPGIVTINDGQTFEGDVIEGRNSVTIKRAGAQQVTINKGNVKEIRYTGAAGDAFQERMAKLNKNDVAGRIALAREASAQGEYD